MERKRSTSEIELEQLRPFQKWRETKNPREREGLTWITHYYGGYLTKGSALHDLKGEKNLISEARGLKLGKKGYGVPTLESMRKGFEDFKAEYEARHGAGSAPPKRRPDQVLEETYPELVHIINALAHEANGLMIEIGDLIEKKLDYSEKLRRWKQIMNTIWVYAETKSKRLDPMFEGEDVKAIPVDLQEK